MAKYIMALDAGTTSNRCILFNEQGDMCSVAQKEFTQYFPKPGWVEHDADEIWSTQYEVAGQAMANINATAADIAAIGITNQRETVVVWDKKTGRPIHNAIVWQCRRTSEYADSLKEKGLTLSYDDELLKYLVKKSYSAAYGARNLRRTIQKEVEDQLALTIINSYDHPVTQLAVTAGEEQVVIRSL